MGSESLMTENTSLRFNESDLKDCLFVCVIGPLFSDAAMPEASLFSFLVTVMQVRVVAMREIRSE